MFCPGRSITRSAMVRAMVSKLWAVMVSKLFMLFMLLLYLCSVLDVSGGREHQDVLEPLTTPAVAADLVPYLLEVEFALVAVEDSLLALEAEEAAFALLHPSLMAVDGEVHVAGACPDVVEKLSYVVHALIILVFC